MIVGQVNAYTEATIPVIIKDAQGGSLKVNSVIDTGFSGYLTLGSALIAALQLPFIESRKFTLGDDSQANFDIYSAIVLWDGEERSVIVLASEAHSLSGMSLLKGSFVFIDVIDGGEVRIKPRA